MSEPKALSIIDSRMSLIEASRDKLQQFLTPLGLNVDRFIHQVRLALRKEPKLQECDPHSLVESVVKAAELGLAPDGALGSAWIIPYAKTAQLVPGYRGLIDLAVRSGAVQGIDATIVHARDVFDFQKGDNPRLTHIPHEAAVKIARWEENDGRVIAFDADEQEISLDPGPMIAAYAVATLASGAKQSLVMGLRDLIALRNRSASWKNPRSAWHDKDIQVLEKMHRKAPVRGICSLLPLSPERARLLQMALELDADDTPEPVEVPAQRRSRVRAAVEDQERQPPAGGTVVDSTATTGEPEPGSGG